MTDAGAGNAAQSEIVLLWERTGFPNWLLTLLVVVAALLAIGRVLKLVLRTLGRVVRLFPQSVDDHLYFVMNNPRLMLQRANPRDDVDVYSGLHGSADDLMSLASRNPRRARDLPKKAWRAYLDWAVSGSSRPQIQPDDGGDQTELGEGQFARDLTYADIEPGASIGNGYWDEAAGKIRAGKPPPRE